MTGWLPSEWFEGDKNYEPERPRQPGPAGNEMSAHHYVSTPDGGVVYCEYCGRIAFDAKIVPYSRIDHMASEAKEPCPLAKRAHDEPLNQ